MCRLGEPTAESAGGRRNKKDALEEGSSRTYHSQSRAGRWMNKMKGNTTRQKRGKFDRSANKYMKRAQPSGVELLDYVNKAFQQANDKSSKNDLEGKAWEIHKAECQEEAYVDQLLDAWKEGGFGILPSKKTDGTLRFTFENYDSLSMFGPPGKRNKLRQIKNKYEPDIMAGIEHGANVLKIPNDRRFEDLLAATTRRTIAASNVHENYENSIPGGTCMFAIDRVANFVIEQDKDYTGLGRWVYMRVGTEAKSTYFVSAYNCKRPSKTAIQAKRRKRSKVWEQQKRYFKKQGEDRDPRVMWNIQLTALMSKWVAQGHGVILATDVNENIYRGMLAKRLAQDDLLMSCQYLKTTGTEAPYSHKRGSQPICAIYATPGIICTNAYQAAHDTGLGDHRLHIYDFDATSILGEDFPHYVRSSGRKLRARQTVKRRQYSRKLSHLCEEHRMCKKVDQLIQNQPNVDSEEYKSKRDKWDAEFCEYMDSAENSCSPKCSGDIPFSPVIKFWIARRWLYNDVIKYHQGKCTDSRNLAKRCINNGIKEPAKTTLEEAKIFRAACESRLESLREIAPMLRQDHLRIRMSAAQAREDETAIDDIKRILQKESSNKIWRPAKLLSGKPRAAPPIAVKIPNEYGEYIKYATKDELNQHTGTALSKRFRLASRAPICSSSLGETLGHVAINSTADEILQGGYDYPEDTEQYTQLILEEAPRVFDTLAGRKIELFIRTDEFQQWWKTANEDIQSSYSGKHFGHYMAAAHDDYLSTLHVAKMNLALQVGIPYTRWTKGLTVLLEKVFGEIYIEKLRAICLFEADFNWITKVIFAKRMMTNARACGIVPPEQFADKNTDSQEGVLASVFSNDIDRTMHRMFAEQSADLGQCFDSVTHPICSIGLQAFGVPKQAVKMTMLTLALMDFFLKSGFGVASDPFSGTEDNKFHGLGQGCGWSGSAFGSTSTLMINAYKRLGHGHAYHSEWNSRAFFLAAVLYVDDAKLMHVSYDRSMSMEDFIEKVQQAVYEWGKLAQATGGYLKQKKCFSYFMWFKFHQGIAKLRKLKDWPDINIVIPQPDGKPDVPIKTLEPTASCLTLGVYTNPAGLWSEQRESMTAKGLEWASALNSHHIKPQHGWIYFEAQLKPKLYHGLVAVSEDPTKLEKAIGKIQFKSLPSLRVNRNIRKEYRMMSEEYQGLGMFNINIDCLGKKISCAIRHWKNPKTIGNMMFHAYEAFIIDLGFDKDIFGMNYDRFQFLSADSWFKHLWCLAWRFRIDLWFRPGIAGPTPIREGDVCLMALFVQTKVFDEDQLSVLQRIRHFKGCFYLSQVTACDGKTITKEARTFRRGNDEAYPYQRPRKIDFDLWVTALREISSSTFTIDKTLGPFIRLPPGDDHWYIDIEDTTLLYNVHKHGTSKYVLDPSSRGRRQWYTFHENVDEPRVTLQIATIERDQSNPRRVNLHSYAPLPSPPPLIYGFTNVIDTWENKSLWTHLDYTGSVNEWLFQGIQNGTIVVVHDGSYMRNIAPDVSSCGVIIIDTSTNYKLTLSIAEQNMTADNYRGEILGAIMALLIFKAAITNQTAVYRASMECHCDNMGVVIHANDPFKILKEKQAQSDMLSLLQQLIRSFPPGVTYQHIKGHQLRGKTFDELSDVAQWNEMADLLARTRLIEAFHTGTYIEGNFPFEDIRVHCDEKKVTSSPSKAIHKFWSYRTARALFHSKRRINQEHFHLIFWNGVGRAMRSFPKMFRIWVTKHVSHFCGTNRQLHRINPDIKNECPSCGCRNEDTAHITRCCDEGRTTMFHSSVDELERWLYKVNTDTQLAEMIIQYLRHRDEATMSSLAPSTGDYQLIAKYHDIMGWDNFIEGRIVILYVEHMRIHYFTIKSRRTAETWAKELIARLLGITHKQWLHRNAKVHIKKLDGKTIVEHEEIMNKVRYLMNIDPMDLLETDRHLLDEDFEHLGSAPAAHREYWVAEMEAATEMATRSKYPRAVNRNGDFLTVSSGITRSDLDNHMAQPIDTEGSIVFRRRKK